MHRDCPGSQVVMPHSDRAQFPSSRPHQSCNCPESPPCAGEADSLVTVSARWAYSPLPAPLPPAHGILWAVPLPSCPKTMSPGPPALHCKNLPGLNLLPVPQNRHPSPISYSSGIRLGDITQCQCRGLSDGGSRQRAFSISFGERDAVGSSNNYSALSGNRLHNLNNLLFSQSPDRPPWLEGPAHNHLLQKTPPPERASPSSQGSLVFSAPALEKCSPSPKYSHFFDHQLLIDYPDALTPNASFGRRITAVSPAMAIVPLVGV